MKDIKFEKWAFIQDITPEDISQAIEGSEALCQAIRNNHWTDVADIIKTRVEDYAQRIAELRVYDEIKTTSVDSIQELEEYRIRQIEKQQEALEKQKQAILTNRLCLDAETLKVHENNIVLIACLRKYVEFDEKEGFINNSIYRDAAKLLKVLGEQE